MKRFLAGAALLGTAVNAQAADLAVKAPYYKAPVVAVYDWTGFYFGVNAGIGIGRDRTDHSFPAAGSFDTTYLSPQGALGGGQIGYNYQLNTLLGPAVIGVEGDIQGTDMREGRTSLNGFGVVSQFNQKLDWFATARGRVGLVTGPVLSYVTAGYAYGNVKTGILENGVTALSTSRGQSGYVVGSGVEAALGGNWTGKIEYLYLNLGNKTDIFAGGTQALDTQIRENIFRVGLNYRIGGNSVYAPVAAANWNGFYIGGNIGSGTGRDRSSIAGLNAVDSFNLAPDGINGGAQAGYNWQAGNVVFGVETDIQASSQRDNRTCVATCSTLLAAQYDAKLPWFGTVRGRIGYSVGSTLFYATGGYAYGNVKTNITTNILGTQTANSLSSTKDGYAVGGGIETPFTLLGLFGPSWTTKTEYLYIDLGRATDTLTNAGVTYTNTTRVTEHVFRTGLNYHFNSPVVAKY